MMLKFKEWLAKESIFGQPVDEPVPDPEKEPSNQAFPHYEVPVARSKKSKKMKKANQSSSSSS